MDNMEENLKESIYSIYSKILNDKQAKKDAKALKKEEEKKQKEDEPKLSKKEKREQAINNWSSIINDLIGEDIDVEKKSVKKKKYKQWISDDEEPITTKPKKVKKKNYDKEFDPEIAKLQRALNIQDKFSDELQNWFKYTLGPVGKGSAAPTKSMVDLAAAINAGRNNSLGIIKEIGNLKKVKANLVMSQKKLEHDVSGGVNTDTSDLGLLGSSLMSSFNNQPQNTININTANVVPPNGSSTTEYKVPNDTGSTDIIEAQAFDPDSWVGPELIDNQVYAESIPHEVVVEKNSQTGQLRFKAIDGDGIELPEIDVSKYNIDRIEINEIDRTVKGEFNEPFKLVIV